MQICTFHEIIATMEYGVSYISLIYLLPAPRHMFEGCFFTLNNKKYVIKSLYQKQVPILQDCICIQWGSIAAWDCLMVTVLAVNSLTYPPTQTDKLVCPTNLNKYCSFTTRWFIGVHLEITYTNNSGWPILRVHCWETKLGDADNHCSWNFHSASLNWHATRNLQRSWHAALTHITVRQSNTNIT